MLFMMASLRPHHLKCFLTNALNGILLVHDPTQCSFDKTVDFRRLTGNFPVLLCVCLNREHPNRLCTKS
jgi:hypothetical protein